MNLHVSYKAGKTPDTEREFKHQIEKLQPRLQVFKPDLVHLHAMIEQDNGRGVSASLNLRLPSGQMAVQRSGENAVAATKAAFADLISQVTKHKELLRGHWTRKSLRRAGRDRLTQMPISAEAMPARTNGKAHAQTHRAAAAEMRPPASKTDGAAVADVELWLSANLRKLEEFIDQELNFQIESDKIREDQITREEVIDEVIVSALSH